MGTLTPSNKEILLFRRMFEEKTKLLGIAGKFFQVKAYNQDYRRDFDKVTFEDPIYFQFIFESHPQIRTLKNLNWYNEDEDILPCLAHLPWFVDEKEIKPSLGALIGFDDPLSGVERKFQVVDINANSFYTVEYVVKLVPYREQVQLGLPEDPTAEDDTNYDYLNKQIPVVVPGSIR